MIAGPTASGKTYIAERAALRTDAEIISADSRTVYRGLKIGNGRYSLSGNIPYHNVDILDIGEFYSCHDFVKDARKYLDTIHAKGKKAILCGGTMHFMDRFVNGIDDLPGPDEKMKGHYRSLAKDHGNHHVHNILKNISPELAQKVHPPNLNRILRYIEISTLKGGRGPIEPYKDEFRIFFLVWPSNILRNRIEKRMEEMFSLGWIDEVRGLMETDHETTEAGLDPIGYPILMDHLKGKISLEEAKREIMTSTVKYARKQMNWLKRLPCTTVHLEEDDELDEVAEGVVNFMNGSGCKQDPVYPRTAA